MIEHETSENIEIDYKEELNKKIKEIKKLEDENKELTRDIDQLDEKILELENELDRYHNMELDGYDKTIY